MYILHRSPVHMLLLAVLLRYKKVLLRRSNTFVKSDIMFSKIRNICNIYKHIYVYIYLTRESEAWFPADRIATFIIGCLRDPQLST